MTTVSELSSQVSVAAACQALAFPRSSFYRSRQTTSPKVDLSTEGGSRCSGDAPTGRRHIAEGEPIAKGGSSLAAGAFAALAKRR